MKKIRQILSIAFDSFVDSLFLIRLSLHLKESNGNKEWHDKEVKLLLQFFAMAFDKSAFEYYCLNNEEYMYYYYYYSLKEKNSGIFQVFCFIYCLIICHTINPILHSLLPIKYLKLIYKFEEKENTIEFSFENKKIEVPKTGDESSIKLIGGILILSISGIAYIIIHNHNKKKQD